MKKILAVFSLILIVGLGSAFVYADSPMANRLQNQNKADVSNTTWEEWSKERMELKKEYLKDAVKEGLVTEEEAKRWEEHFDYMEEFHRDNGYRGCFGGMGMMRRSRR